MTERFLRAAALSDLEAADGVLAATVGGEAVALYLVEGEVFATHDLCTHGHARLSEGYLDGDQIECPLHQGMFDVRTGRAVTAPCSIPVRTYPVRVEEGEILIGLDDAAGS